ncbi:GspE/PulE family protein [Neptuniibacter sp. 1_MG-2023]|jgi:MSHA biogenesis protein MshE|uniref:GspE/PulE family protein n=1 Tax=Neptuniibacter sp. 1_MG-2023 TaxID=3062662 RepID=UPI0026E37CFE|nr:GspE/PulE family protein [Neptuniibacter sp. 1_MG-2023]MDO6594596.1 GspE/PulE family protein [Neptuniibacter sp. 1_MG-2023]
MGAPKMKIRIGDLLVQNGVLSEAQLIDALDKQKQTRQKLGKTLVSMGYVKEQQFLDFLSQQLNIPLVELTHYSFNQEDVLRLPETQARRFRALVLKEDVDHFLVGMSDPMDIFAFDELQRVLPKPIEIAVVSEAQLLQSMDLLYRKTSDIEDLADQLNDEIADDAFDLAALTATDEVDVPVVKLLKSLFEDAVQVGASDIHIEPDETVLRIRQRIDGVLHEHVMKEKRIASALVLRLKLMASLNISEKRLPQDGRFNISVKGHSVDVRISTLPIQFGESVVMRLLDQSGGIIGLEKAGLPNDMLHRLRRMIHEPHGLLLVTGPTGSGKTTTLYGALNELNSHQKKIITVEDPVEYRLPRVNQVQVHPNIGLDFSTVLRATLRQDPDILLVGEIRDKETADIALRAAMTGHFVLSTLHTNDAVSSAMRLTDIGIEGYLVASALNGILAQRLVRKICENCSHDYQPTDSERLWLDMRQEELGLDNISLQKGRGCTYCNNTGYKGRTGIFELLEINENMADALRRNDSAGFTIAAKTDPHYQPLAYSALELAIAGVTSLDEVFRVTEQLDESIYLDAPDASIELGSMDVGGLELE